MISEEDTIYVDTSKHRLVYLYASPLVDRLGQELRLLDTQQEIELLRESLRDAHRQLHFRVDVATPQNLRTVATNGAVMIHYSGHGSPDILAFENGRGEVHRLEVESLRSLFSAGGVHTKVVFVSACHSEMAGRKFTEAGVEHVIALNNRVTDNSSRIFAQNFYISLFRGKQTVQEAFDIASNMVMVMEGGKPSDEKKFLLLPEDKSHDTIIFPNCPEGDYIDETDELAYNGCDRALKSFIGRNRVMQQIFSFLGVSNNRWVTIRGERGIGKTTLSSRVCEYMNERKLFDAIYFVPLKRMGATSSSDCNQLAEIFGRCIEGDLRNREYHNGNVGGANDTEKSLGIYNIEDLIRVVKWPARPKKTASSLIGGRTDRKSARILFVIDNCDAFVPHAPPHDHASVPDTGFEVAQPFKSASPSPHASSVQATPVTHPMGLIHLLDNLFRRTDNVKCLLTASTRILGFQDVLLINEPEKVITLERLTDKQSAELMVKLAPRGLKPSEMNSNSPLTALDTLAARPVLKDLGGHPRAIAMFCSVLADKLLDDSEAMRRFAQDALQRAKAWQEVHTQTTFTSASPCTSTSSSAARGIDKQGHFPIPVAVAVSTNTSSSPAGGVSLAMPHRVTRSTSESTSIGSRPPLLSNCNSSGALFSMAPHSKITTTTGTGNGNGTSNLIPRAPTHQPPMHQVLSPPVPPRFAVSQESFQPNQIVQPTQDATQTPQKLNIKNVDPAVLDEAYKVSRTIIRDRACADVWAKVSALAAGGGNRTNNGQVTPVIPTSVRWSALISALSESLEAETRVSCEVEARNSSDVDMLETHTISLARRLTKDDAKFLFHRMQLDQSSVVNSTRGHVDYVVERSRFMVFCEWWAPLLKSLTILNTEFSCKKPILIHGFMNRQKTEDTLLSAKEVGVFLLRFSESHAGYLVVSFTDLESEGAPMKVHHCLVNVGSDGVSIYFERGECKYLSLQELIMNCSNLLILYPNIRKEDAFDEIMPFVLSK